jgi:hypothetical protein
MPSGDKSSYTDKQRRQAQHIEEGYEKRGVSKPEAERRAYATVNAETGGGKKSGSGRGRPVNHAPSRKGGMQAAPPRPAAPPPSAPRQPRRPRPHAGAMQKKRTEEFHAVAGRDQRILEPRAASPSAAASTKAVTGPPLHA